MTHMEWFTRPDGSVAVSEVAARPPGAQISSMLGYVHDMDFYSAWCELVVLGRFQPRERRYAAGTAYLRGLGRIAVVLVEQYLDFARELGDYFAVMDRGAIVYSCSREGMDEAALRRAMAI